MIKDKITPEIKRMFIDAIEATVRTGNEHGFLICKNIIGELKPTQMCEGEKCIVSLEELECPFITEGNFHTHPDIANHRKIFPDMSDDEIKDFVFDMASYFNAIVPGPGHADLVYALLGKLYKGYGGVVCVGSDANIDTVSCWTAKDDLTKEEINRSIDIMNEEIKKGELHTIAYKDDWIDSYFDKEIIDLK